jgi:Rab proteins geranylgeranyltransferase component A
MNDHSEKLSASRSYTLTLSPQLIYTKSSLLPVLVSSRLHAQVEFQAVGTWWIYKDAGEASRDERQDSEGTNDHAGQHGSANHTTGALQKIPSTREDVFADETLSPREKRSLMKFLRSVVLEPDSEAEPVPGAPLSSPLTTLQAMTPTLSESLLALSLSHDSPGAVKTTSAISRIRRHIQSIGVFGPGFGAVMPKYGGGAEIAQVACRASAVGGAVYVLGRGLKKLAEPHASSAEATAEAKAEASAEEFVGLELSDGEEIRARFVAGCAEDLPTDTPEGVRPSIDLVKTLYSISIISSPLEHLFPPTSESGPVPAGAVVVMYGCHDPTSEDGPVYMLIHSSESGECPTGQCEYIHNTPRAVFLPFFDSSFSDDSTYEYLSTLSATSLLINNSDKLTGTYIPIHLNR